jgi:hypothetical protein
LRKAGTNAKTFLRVPSPARPGWLSGTLTAEQIPAVTWLATVMNAFNRAAITSRYHAAA